MNPKVFFIKYGLPLLIVGVAAAQFYQVYFHQMTRWKGGGFGMYSETHPKLRQVWMVKPDTAIRFFDLSNQPESLVRTAHRIKFSPTQNRLKKLAKDAAKVYGTDTVTIQVWEPFLKTETNLLSMKLIGEQYYAKTP